MAAAASSSIKAIDGHSIHKLTSGQVVVDLQTAVKELVENSLDAGATSIEVRFREYGLKTIEVIDNGSGIAAEDYDSIGLKHHTSKLSSYEDLTSVLTFGFRGEAVSSLCAMSETVTVTTATASQAPMGTVIELDKNGHVVSRDTKVARQRGTTVTITGLFKPLVVRRKELERNAKREYGKALNLLNAYALVPCAKENNGVRLTVSNQDGGRKSIQIRTDGSASTRASVSALWSPKSLENLVELKLDFDVETEKSVLRRQTVKDPSVAPPKNHVRVVGLISKFSLGCGRTATDRQFFFINGRPCNPLKVQKAFNEVYRSFNINQSPFVIADFILPTDSCDINVSPDKRTILLHSEGNLIQALKLSLEESFSSSRATYSVNEASQSSRNRQISGQIHPATQNQPQSKLIRHSESASNPDCDVNIDESPPSILQDLSHPSSKHGLDSRGTLENCAAIPSKESRLDQVPLFVPSRSSSPATNAGAHASTLHTGTISLPLSTPSLQLAADELSQSSHNPPEPYSSPTASQFAPRKKDVTHSTPQIVTDDEDGDTRAEALLQLPARSGVKRKEPLKQMVLDTTGAAWNIPRENSIESSGRPSKKVRIIDENEKGDGRKAEADEQGKKKARQTKASLWDFAMSGSQAGPNLLPHGTPESEDEDICVEMEVDHKYSPKRTPKSDNVGQDMCIEMELDGKCESSDGRSHTGVRVLDRMDVVEDTEEIDELTGDTDEQADPSLSAPSPRGAGHDEPIGLHQNGDRSDLPPPASPVPRQDIRRKIMRDSRVTTDAIVFDSSTCDPDLDSEEENLPVSPNTAEPHVPFFQEFIRTKDGEETLLQLDLSKLTNTWVNICRRPSEAFPQPDTAEPLQSVTYVDDDAGLHNTDGEAAAKALSRVIDKDDFNDMGVIGQFNMGFIIVRRHRQQSDKQSRDESAIVDDLFIVDQHAADEKYNFENLRQTVKFQAQQLVRPQPLQLSAAEEMLAIENMDILTQNGFELMVNDEEGRDPAVSRLSLVGLPMSKTTVFDMKDLEELLHLMQDHPTGPLVRCSKTRAMLAMRACRKSIMVGLPLNHKQMTSIVRHMSIMDQPWNCPHGRPTMRHLCDLSCVSPRRIPQLDWDAFCPTEASGE